MNVIGMVCLRTGELFIIEATRVDTGIFQVFLNEADKFIKPERKRNVIILDNASWHKGKALNPYFASVFF